MKNGVRSVCFRGDFAIKHTSRILTLEVVWKCVTHWSILFICNTFSCWLVLLSFLYIELALVCCKNPDNVNCFGTIFPNLKFGFSPICAVRPVPMRSDQYRSCSTVKRRDGATRIIPMGSCKNSTVALTSRNDMISILQRSARTNWWSTKHAKWIKYGHVADLQKLSCQPGSKNGLIYKILMSSFCSYLELRFVSLIDDAQNMQKELIYQFLQLTK